VARSDRQGEKSQHYYDLLERCRSKKRQRYSTELIECMLIKGVTMEQALQSVYEFLGSKYPPSKFKSFIKHRINMGWVITEENGVWRVIDIRP